MFYEISKYSKRLLVPFFDFLFVTTIFKLFYGVKNRDKRKI